MERSPSHIFRDEDCIQLQVQIGFEGNLVLTWVPE